MTNNGGLFQAINASALSGNLNVLITSDLITETGTHALNQWNENPAASNYTLTIAPNSATLRTISNGTVTAAAPMIPFNGADRVTIDGRFSGSGQYLLFRNVDATPANAGPTIQFFNTSINNVLRNCIIENNTSNAARGALMLTTGNNTNIQILQNIFRNVTVSPFGDPSNMIYSNVAGNTGNTAASNEFANFTNAGILLGSSNGGTWTIGGTTADLGNRFYQSNAIATAQTAINIGGTGSGHIIRHNLIGGNAAPIANVIQGTWTNSGGVTVNGILIGNSASATISNNTIQSFSLTSGSSIFNGISVTSSGVNTIQTNLIGSTSTASSILIAGTLLKGIVSSSTSTFGMIGGASSGLGNTVSNISATSAGQVFGIHTTAGANTIQNNLIHTLNTAIPSGTAAAASVIGISQNSTTANQLVSTNTIYGLANTNAGSSTLGVTGIYYAGPTSGTNLIDRNLIYGLSVASDGTAAIVTGISAAGGLLTVSNNMIRMGINTSGASLSGANIHVGIDKSSTNNMSFHFNSVFVGGADVASFAANTFAFRRTASGTDNIRNNIFVNNRANATIGGIHYALSINDHTSVTCNYNIYQATGTGGILATTNGSNRATLQVLRAGFIVGSNNQDLNSAVGNPNFVNPTTATPNLHVQSPTPAESSGILIATIAEDFDGQTRTDFTQTDIGADAGNFTGLDIFTPVVTVSTISTQVPCGGLLEIPVTATVTDVGGGVASGGLAPTLWWRLSTGTYAPLLPISSSGNTYNYLLQISGVAAGQTYQYYVAAQDLAGNIFYSNYNASSPVHSNVGATPSTVNVNPASFNISSITPLSGTIAIGGTIQPGEVAGETWFSSLTRADGFFRGVFDRGLSSDLSVVVRADITNEDGNFSLNPWNEYCGSNYYVTIRPESSGLKTLSGSLLGMGLFPIYASRVVIDGNYDDTGRYLRFLNTYTGTGGSENNTFRIGNSSSTISDVVIRNCQIEGNSTKAAGGVVYISRADDITLDNNIIRGGSSWSTNIIRIDGVLASSNNINITNNEIFNFLSWTGIRSFGILSPSIVNNLTITGNSIYNSGANGQSPQTAISIQGGTNSSGHVISDNFIGGSSPLCGSAGLVPEWRNTTLSDLIMIDLSVSNDESTLTTISNNTIQNIWSSSGDAGGVTNIWVKGSSRVNITGNTIGHPTLVNNIQSNGGGISFSSNSGWMYGIYSQTSSQLEIRDNLIAGLAAVGSFRSYNTLIEHTGAGRVIIENNTLANSYNGGGTFGFNTIGIFLNNSTSNHEITRNTITKLGNASSTPDFNESDGIVLRGSSSGVISHNVLSEFFTVSNGTWSTGIGMAGTGNWDVYNNIVNMLNQSWLSEYTTRKEVYGIYDISTSGIKNIYNNTVLVTGSQTGTAGFAYPSACYYKLAGGNGSSAGSNTTLRNNILINNRTGNPNVDSKHYAIDNTSNPVTSNWSSDYNFLSTDNINTLGFWAGTGDRNFSQWQSSSSGDANSTNAQALTSGINNTTNGTVNPLDLFIDPSIGNLRIKTTSTAPYQAFTYVLDEGETIAMVTDDIDGVTRPQGPNYDMGADEFIANDIAVINVRPACSGNQLDVTIRNYGTKILNTLLINWSVNGVNQTQANITGLNVVPGNEHVITIGTYSFSPGVAYNVVVVSSMPNGELDGNASNDTYTANPLYFNIPSPIYVGGATGSPRFDNYSLLFNALNNSTIHSNINVLVQGNTSEPDNATFLNASGSCGGDFSIFIRPISNSTYTATGNSGNAENPGMIGFNGASNVYIDGSYSNDETRRLIYRNINTNFPAFAFQNDANAIGIEYTTIESANNITYLANSSITNPAGVVYFGRAKSSGVGNNEITIANNAIRNRSDASGTPAIGIFSHNFAGSGTLNANIEIIQNEIFNFSQVGIYIPNVGNGSEWKIRENSIYCESNMASLQSLVPQHVGIYFAAGSTSHSNEIVGNTIGGNAADNSGMWNNTLSSIAFEAIRVEVGGSSSLITRVDSNTVKNINLTGTSLGAFVGIRVKEGFVNLTGNTIGDLNASFSSPSIFFAGRGIANGSNNNAFMFGIWNYSTDASEINNNVIAGLRNTGGYAYMTGIRRGAREYGTNALNVYAGRSIIRGNTITRLYSETGLSNVYMNGLDVDKVWPGALTGIALRSDFPDENLLDSNLVYQLEAYGTWNRWVRLNGIAVNGSTNSSINNGVVSRNLIYNLNNNNGGIAGFNSYTPAIAAIVVGGHESTATLGSPLTANGSFTFVNNMIHLAPTVLSSNAYNNPDVYGILDLTKSGNTNRYYYNTVYITGAGKSSLPGDAPIGPGYAFLRSSSGDGTTQGGTTHLQNNILINNRTGFVKNYVIGNNTATPSTGWSGTNINYNFLSGGNINTVGHRVIGNYQTGPSTDYTFNGWRTTFSSDANSLFAQTVGGATPSFISSPNDPTVDVVNPNAGYLFVNPDDILSPLSFLHIDQTDGISELFVNANGVSVSGITTDIDGDIRDVSTPFIGADEANVCQSPIVTLQPLDQSNICIGEEAIFTANVTGLAPLNYQWQESTDGGSSWNNLSDAGIYSGTETNTLTISAVSSTMNNYQYKLLIDNVCGNNETDEAVLTVPAGPAITAYSPLTFINTLCSGNTNFEVTATGNGLTYQWQESTDNETTWNDVVNGGPYSGATTNKLDFSNIPPPNLNGNKYRVIITDDCNNELISNVGTLNVGVAYITSQPVVEQTVCEGTTVQINVTATGNGPTYIWQVSVNNGTSWNNTSGPVYSGNTSNTLEFDATSAMSGNLYRVIVNSSCNTPSNSDESLLNVEFPGLWLGNGSDWDTPANWGCGVLPTSTTDVLIPTNPINGNIFPEIGSANTSVSRDLTIATGASLDVTNTNDLSIYGNLTNDGFANLGQGFVRMRSSTTQLIDGTSESEFGTLVIDNTNTTGPAVELNQDIVVLNQLILENGKLHLNSKDIDLLGTGVVVNENNINRIYGDQGEIKTIIDLAANTNYDNIFGLGVSITTSATAPGMTVIERGHFQHTHLGSYQSIQRYYDIQPTVNTSLNATLRMAYFDDELEVSIGPPPVKANLLPWRSTDNGTTWEGQFIPASLSNNIVANWVQLSNIPAFSRWTLSDWVDHPLPIQLLSFTATANYTDQSVDLKWITASEINNALFTVERSNDAVQFQPILSQNGAGNSNAVITYTDIDPNPFMGISYYRLKQTDFDGNSSYSDIAPVNFASPLSESLNAYAGEKGTIRLNYHALSRGNLDVKLYDAGGRLIGIYNFQATKGSNQLVIDGLNLAPGVYIIQANNGEQVFFDKLMLR